MRRSLRAGHQEQRAFAPDHGVLAFAAILALLGQHAKQIDRQIGLRQLPGTNEAHQFHAAVQCWLQEIADQLAPGDYALLHHLFVVAGGPFDPGRRFELAHQRL